eukprot:scaffold388868_cov31-Prasinocladus_malaysianus.AAC.1
MLTQKHTTTIKLMIQHQNHTNSNALIEKAGMTVDSAPGAFAGLWDVLVGLFGEAACKSLPRDLQAKLPKASIPHKKAPLLKIAKNQGQAK